MQPRKYCPTNQYSLVLFAVVSQDEIFQLNLRFDPFLVRQRRPDMVGLGNSRLIRLEDDFGPVIIHMESSQDEDQTREGL